VGDRSGLFIGKTKAPSGEMVRADTSGGTFEVGAMMRSLPDGSMEITWAYAIDRARYEASVRKGRG
jgi:hypothetical protein